jgi:hypothetical protein
MDEQPINVIARLYPRKLNNLKKMYMVVMIIGFIIILFSLYYQWKTDSLKTSPLENYMLIFMSISIIFLSISIFIKSKPKPILVYENGLYTYIMFLPFKYKYAYTLRQRKELRKYNFFDYNFIEKIYIRKSERSTLFENRYYIDFTILLKNHYKIFQSVDTIEELHLILEAYRNHKKS